MKANPTMISTPARIDIFFISVFFYVLIISFLHPSVGGGSRSNLSQFCECGIQCRYFCESPLVFIAGCSEILTQRWSNYSSADCPAGTGLRYSVIPEKNCPEKFRDRKLRSSSVLHPSAKMCYYYSLMPVASDRNGCSDGVGSQ